MEPQNSDFGSYTLNDLISNAQFARWVLAPDEPLNAYWQSLQNQYPGLILLIPHARTLVLSLRFQTDVLEDREKDMLWQQIADQTILKKSSGLVIPLWLRSIAAALLVAVLLSVAFYFYSTRQTELSTPYGKVARFTLPDGSAVTLNGNSHLRYAANWNKDRPREVWVMGEAFFRVSHLHQTGLIKPQERFIVHARKADVEVLGTTFNVTDRRDEVTVALITGKVSFSIKKNAKVIMQPGDLVQYRTGQDTVIKKRANAAEFADWRTGVLHFNQTPLSELLRYIEDVYGYKANVSKPEIAALKLTGTFSNPNLDALLLAVSKTLGISIEKNSSAHQLIVNY